MEEGDGCSGTGDDIIGTDGERVVLLDDGDGEDFMPLVRIRGVEGNRVPMTLEEGFSAVEGLPFIDFEDVAVMSSFRGSIPLVSPSWTCVPLTAGRCSVIGSFDLVSGVALFSSCVSSLFCFVFAASSVLSFFVFFARFLI